MQDFFPTMAMKANPQCNDRHCREQQEEYKVGAGHQYTDYLAMSGRWNVHVCGVSLSVEERSRMSKGRDCTGRRGGDA